MISGGAWRNIFYLCSYIFLLPGEKNRTSNHDFMDIVA